MKQEAKLWVDFARDDLKSMRVMWEAHRYGPTAFYCQQIVEKMLKAVITERGNKAPRKSHDLVRLLEDAKLADFPKAWLAEIKEMGRHYFRVRYPDLGKRYYSRRDSIAKIMAVTGEVYLWLRKKLRK